MIDRVLEAQGSGVKVANGRALAEPGTLAFNLGQAAILAQSPSFGDKLSAQPLGSIYGGQ